MCRKNLCRAYPGRNRFLGWVPYHELARQCYAAIRRTVVIATKDFRSDFLRKLTHYIRTPGSGALRQLGAKRSGWLELFHGPGLWHFQGCFALQLLGSPARSFPDQARRAALVIMGATSGDTGSAAIEGCQSTARTWTSLFCTRAQPRLGSACSGVDDHHSWANNIHNLLPIDGQF